MTGDYRTTEKNTEVKWRFYPFIYTNIGETAKVHSTLSNLTLHLQQS